MKWRTRFPFIIKLYGLVAKTTCFGVNGIWVWFETNYLNSLRIHFLIFKMGVMMVPGVMMLLWGLYDKRHIKCSEQGLERTHHSVSINFYSVSKYCQRGLGKKGTHHCEVVRTQLAPRALISKNQIQEVFQQRLSGSIKAGAGLATWVAGPGAKWKRRASCSRSSENFKTAAAKQETTCGVLLSPGPCAAVQVTGGPGRD